MDGNGNKIFDDTVSHLCVKKRWQQMVFEQIAVVGWNYIRHISADLTEIIIDAGCRAHPQATLIFVLCDEYPRKVPDIKSSPVRFEPCIRSIFTLVDIRNEFMKHLVNFPLSQIPNKIAISTSAPQSPVELHPIVVLSTDCSICYNQFASYSLRDEVAVIKCSNEKCSNVFHAPCAREWLVSLSSSKIMFGTLYGACPYCGSELQVPVI